MPERIVIQRVPIIEKVCPVCGRSFEGVAKQGYCSLVCRNKASYMRHAEARRAARRERYHQQKEG